MDKRPDDDNQVDFTDLPSLPPNEIRVLGHIIRNQGARRAEIIAAFSSLPEGEGIDSDELDQILAGLVQKRLLNTGESGGETTYSPRMRRKTSQIRTIQGIWNALDSDGDPLESEMHSEMRKARSDIANNLLADMSELDQISTEAAPATDEARRTGESLLSDLTSTGRTSMSKRETAEPGRKPEKKRESMGRLLQEDIAASKPKAEKTSEDSTPEDPNRILDDLAAKLKKQTGIHPVVKSSLWRKLLSWLGRG